MQLLSKHVVEKNYNSIIENYRYNIVWIAGNKITRQEKSVTHTFWPQAMQSTKDEKD